MKTFLNTECPIKFVKSVQIRNFFWSVFSLIRAEYGEILRISPYLVRMWENTDQHLHTFQAAITIGNIFVLFKP